MSSLRSLLGQWKLLPGTWLICCRSYLASDWSVEVASLPVIRQGAAPISLMIGQAPDFCFLAWDWWSSVVFFFCRLWLVERFQFLFSHSWLAECCRFRFSLVIGGELTFLLFLDFSCLDILVRKWLIALHNYLMIMKMIVYENYDYPNLEDVHVLLRRT